MKPITYRQLASLINKMHEEMKDKNITLYVEGEYFPAELLTTDADDDVLGGCHPYLKIKDGE